MGNCLLLLGLKKEKRPVTLLLVGLDNAGKTTAAKGIVGDPVEDVAPTVGFAPENLEYRGCEITIYDLGGGSKIRPVWKKYFSEVHGVIFVVDSSDSARIRECREVLFSLLADKKIAGKPVLVLANKQDVEGAMDEIDLVESLNVEQVVNKHKCPTRVETCSAITTRKQKPDKPIADGFRWLIDTIVVHYKEINKRVTHDLEKERIKLKKEMDERRERLRRLRAERERQQDALSETASRRAVSEVNPSEHSDDSDVVVVVDVAAPAEQPGRSSSSSSGIPNGTLPQSRSTINNLRTERGNVRHSPDEQQELKELGFNSQADLQESSSSSSSPQGSPDSTPSCNKGPELPSARVSPSREKENCSCEPPVAVPPTKPHRVILVQESPKHILMAASESSQHQSHSLSPSSADRDADSGILDVKSYTNNIAPGSVKLDLSNEERDGECVPIESDDELFDISSIASSKRDSQSPFTVRTPSNSSVRSFVKGDHLELESTNKPVKKKSFLKRYHKTAPLVSNGSSTTGTKQDVNHIHG